MDDRRSGLTRRAALAASGALVAAGSTRAWAQAKQAPITIVVNQSPWFEGFRRTVELYRKETGNAVALDVNPFAGSLEKQRSAARSGTSPFDIFVINAGFFVEMYTGGFLRPLNEIDPAFKLDPAVYTFDDSVFWNTDTKRVDQSGKLMTVPINPYIPLMHYRSDLYEQKGLKIPETWDDLLANAKALNAPPRMYGIVQRGARGAFDVTYDVLPYLWSHGGDIFKDQKGGDFTVTINSRETLAGLETYLRLEKEAGHPHTAGQTQTDVIQAMATGRAGHIISVLAASQFDDPSKSAVVGKIGFAPPPHAPGFQTSPPLGHWLGGIPRNIPEDRQHAALAFLAWFQTRDAQTAYAKAGAPPVRRDVMESELAKQPEFRWMPALAGALPHARLTFVIPQAAEILAITELRFNQAIGGEMSAATALNTMSAEIAKVMTAAGYKAPVLPDLKDVKDPIWWRAASIAPAFLMFLLLTALPVAMLLALSVHDIAWTAKGVQWSFTGLRHYAALLSDGLLRASVVNTLVFAIVAVCAADAVRPRARAAHQRHFAWADRVSHGVPAADPDPRHRDRRDLEADVQLRLRHHQHHPRRDRAGAAGLAWRAHAGARLRHRPSMSGTGRRSAICCCWPGWNPCRSTCSRRRGWMVRGSGRHSCMSPCRCWRRRSRSRPSSG